MGSFTPRWEGPKEGQRKARVVLCAGAELGTPPGVRAAGPDDVAWQRPLWCDSREAGAAGTARGLVLACVCL